MNEKEQMNLIKFIADQTIYVNIGGIGFAYAITDLAKFSDELIEYLKKNERSIK